MELQPPAMGGRGTVHHVVLYTKGGCCLCDRAKALLRKLQGEFALDIEEVDIEADASLLDRYGDIIPVVVVDGRHRVESKVTEYYLRRALAGDHRPGGRWPWQQ